MTGLLALGAAIGCRGTDAAQEEEQGEGPGGDARFRLLVFSKTAAFRHESIPDGVAAIRRLGAEHGFSVTATEDAAVFREDALAPFAAVVFLNTSGAVLDAAQQEAFRTYVEGGGGFAGVHAASDTEYDWPWYGTLVGAYFAGHPHNQDAVVHVVDEHHPSTRGLPERWARYDEWYNFKAPPRDVRVLAYLDEASYTGGTMGDRHPIAWCREVGRGRAWYTALGHTRESYAEPLFLTHLAGGLLWAAREAE